MQMDEGIKGGYRLKGQTSVKEPGFPVVSVITVVFNSENLLERTIDSVLKQTYPNIEYIIIDGGSRDATVEIIRKYDDRIAYWISESDRGLYDAMNKGLAAATGDYLWFLNSGDLAYRADTLEKTFKDQRLKIKEQRSGDQETRSKINDLKPDTQNPIPNTPNPTSNIQHPTSNIQHPTSDIHHLIYYGDTMIVDSDYKEVGLRRFRPPEVLTWKSFRKGMLVCHQAILVHRSIAGPYDLKYRHSADFDWVLRALVKAEGIINTRQILCAFLDGGHSKQNIPASLRERFDIMRRNYGLIPTALRHMPIVFRFAWYYIRNKRF